MIKVIPMEDWLRGCVYHDGRHGTVTLPTDKVLQIANYIQRTRRSISDGLIDLEVEPRITGKHIDQIIFDLYHLDEEERLSIGFIEIK